MQGVILNSETERYIYPGWGYRSSADSTTTIYGGEYYSAPSVYRAGTVIPFRQEGAETGSGTCRSSDRGISELLDACLKLQQQKKTIMQEASVMADLLANTEFETGYTSPAQQYYRQLSDRNPETADKIIHQIYVNCRGTGSRVLKHLLYLISDLPQDRRSGFAEIPRNELFNPDIEVQDLSVQCIESWEDKLYVGELIRLRDGQEEGWFADYINDVIAELMEGTE